MLARSSALFAISTLTLSLSRPEAGGVGAGAGAAISSKGGGNAEDDEVAGQSGAAPSLYTQAGRPGGSGRKMGKKIVQRAASTPGVVEGRRAEVLGQPDQWRYTINRGFDTGWGVYRRPMIGGGPLGQRPSQLEGTRYRYIEGAR